jgi:hypothetical protein
MACTAAARFRHMRRATVSAGNSNVRIEQIELRNGQHPIANVEQVFCLSRTNPNLTHLILLFLQFADVTLNPGEAFLFGLPNLFVLGARNHVFSNGLFNEFGRCDQFIHTI